MTKKNRKVVYYDLESENQNELFMNLKTILNTIIEFDKLERTVDIENNKFLFIDHYSEKGNYLKISFKSAQSKFRPDLLNRSNLKERKNPKLPEEGDKVLTHGLIYSNDNDNNVTLILEQVQNGLTIKQFTKYINGLISQIEIEQPIIGSSKILVDNFEQELENISRILSAEIYLEKEAVGSDYLNVSSDRFHEIRNEIIVTVKAKPRGSIENWFKDQYAKFATGDNPKVKKTKLYTKTTNNNDNNFFVDHIERKEFVKVETNSENGDVVTLDMFEELIELAKSES